MVVHHYAESVIIRVDNNFKLKPSSIGDPNIYLGAKLKTMRIENELWAWAKTPAIYVKERWQTLRSIWLSWLMDVHS